VEDCWTKSPPVIASLSLAMTGAQRFAWVTSRAGERR